MKIEQIYHDFVEQLKKIYNEREAANIVELVFESVAGIKRLQRLTDKQQQLANSTIQQLNVALQKLLKHQPVQYVLSEAWFYKMKLFVNEHVLIPRPETEELVEWIVSDARGTMLNAISDVGCRMYDVGNKNYKIDNAGRKADNVLSKISGVYAQKPNVKYRTTNIIDIIDIGTGSGCIAIALKKELPGANILGIDVSAEALSVAKKNAGDQNTNIELAGIDFLDNNTWHQLPLFDVIVSNPPYIPRTEKNKLEKNVVEYEPHLALFVEDNDPFIFYKKTALFADIHLRSNGKIYVEVHEKYADKVMDIFHQFKFTAIIKKDIYGCDRMIRATR
jgi:release factor glutamine methyltransferase